MKHISKTDYHIKKIDWIFLINELNEINEIHSLTNIAALTIYMYRYMQQTKHLQNFINELRFT